MNKYERKHRGELLQWHKEEAKAAEEYWFTFFITEMERHKTNSLLLLLSIRGAHAEKIVRQLVTDKLGARAQARAFLRACAEIDAAKTLQKESQ